MILNLALFAGLTFLLANHSKTTVAAPLVLSEAKPPAPHSETVSLSPSPSETAPLPFCWSDLESSNGYRGFIANLRAVGCPETTIADIVRGNVERAFSWERSRLGLGGYGTGPWSEASEIALINDLLGNAAATGAAFYSQNSGARQADLPPIAPQSAGNTPQENNGEFAQLSGSQSFIQNNQTTASSSWFSQGGARNANAGSASASANQSAGQGEQPDANGDRQNSGSGSQPRSGSWSQEGGDPNSSPEQSSVSESSPNAQSSDDPFTESGQDIMAEQQAQYYKWYEPQALAAAENGTFLVINPDGF